MNKKTWSLLLLILAVVVAGLLSHFASDYPDGLDKTLADVGHHDAPPSTPATSPLPDYHLPGISNYAVSVGLAGLIGVGATLGLTLVVGKLVTRKKSPSR